MIGYLSGKVKFVFGDACILDVNGVGYRIFVDERTRQTLSVGAAAEFFIHTAVREDAINLFGMKEQTTFELFELLLTVSGIGARSALAIVSKISAADFARAVAAQDVKTLTRLPGIGKKSAERIVLELKEKILTLAENFPAQIQSAPTPSAALQEASEALEALGYSVAEISAALQNSPPDATVDRLIKLALAQLNRFA